MEQKLLELALRVAHPPAHGWRQLGPYELDGLDLQTVFYRKGHTPVAVLYMDGAVLKPDDVKLALHLQNIYRQRMNGRQLHMLLVYQGLLLAPAATPKGISVMSISSGEEEHHHRPSLN